MPTFWRLRPWLAWTERTWPQRSSVFRPSSSFSSSVLECSEQTRAMLQGPTSVEAP